MTYEEFTTEAEQVISPAIERLVQMAFETLPVEMVELQVDLYLDRAKTLALEIVRNTIAVRN